MQTTGQDRVLHGAGFHAMDLTKVGDCTVFYPDGTAKTLPEEHVAGFFEEAGISQTAFTKKLIRDKAKK